MNNEFIIVAVLAVLSVVGIAWNKISSAIKSKDGGDPITVDPSIPTEFEYKMRLIHELIDLCEGCEAETKAVTAAGDVIAKHWKDSDHE
tara:strand:- start:1165 stop:1431 length:267 start_codon:yes stop_codon:yes gene_type:complete